MLLLIILHTSLEKNSGTRPFLCAIYSIWAPKTVPESLCAVFLHITLSSYIFTRFHRPPAFTFRRHVLLYLVHVF